MTRNHNTQSGAVFYYILLAVALVAALSYVVSRDNRGSSGMLSDDQAHITANEIIEYGNTVATAIQKLILRGCSDTEISFENNTISGYTNTNAPSDKSCHVFDLNGGNINFFSLPDKVLDNNIVYYPKGEPIFVGDECIHDVGTNTPACGAFSGTKNIMELLMWIPGLKYKTCLAINDKVNPILNMNNAASMGQINYIQGPELVKFTGSYIDYSDMAAFRFYAEYDGTLSGCVVLPCASFQGTCDSDNPNDNGYIFYKVLIAR